MAADNLCETKVEDNEVLFGVEYWGSKKCQNCQSVRFLAKMEYKTVAKRYSVNIRSEQRISERKLIECLKEKYAKCEDKYIGQL